MWTFPALPTCMRRHLPGSVVRFARVAILALCIAGVPALTQAQQRDSTAALKPGTVLHTVRTGDTLFEIARRYLGNPFRWPELFRANSGQIANANLIYPGQKLYVGADGRPTFTPEAVAAEVDTAEAAPTRAMPLGRNPSGQAVSVLENATLNGRALRPTVRRGEAAAAPFLVPLNARMVSGNLVSRSDPTIISAALSRDQFQLFDEVDVLLPAGMRGIVGQQFGVYQPGPEVRHERLRSRLMQPSGVVELVALGTGRAARARVTSMFANMKKGDLLMALDTASVPSTVRPQDVSNGPVYEVAYISGGVVLPTVQNFVVIALPKGATSRVGDQFTLYADGQALTEGTKDVSPSNTVAQVSVVKVTPESATAVVVGHDQPAIRVGMKARLVSRMP
jgi:LysM repeat protein